MRDIVTSNGLQTKTNVAKTTSNTGTLTKTDYRSYRDFLESFNDNKNSKDDQESVSSNDSGISSYKLCDSRSNNTSTSSLNSENGTSLKSSSKIEQNTGFVNRTGSFRNYLESYNNKKFSSVKPQVLPKKNMIKSEIVIQVNDPLQTQEKTEPDSCCVTTINGDFDFTSPPVNMDVPNFPPPPPPLQIQETHTECALSPPPPPPPPPTLSGATGKKWATITTENDRPKPPAEKLVANNAAAANLAKILTQHLLPRRMALETEMSEENSDSKPVNGTITTSNGKSVISVVPPAPKLPSDKPKVSQNFAYVPVVPKLPTQPKLPETLPPRAINGAKWAQPTHVAQKAVTVEQAVPKLPQTLPPKAVNGGRSNGSVEYNTTTVVPVMDGTAKVSKTDPNVKKLVYNTYRGLLGAYNNKANDMISTLPRNMVREDQGVTKQLESIALQGGLEKLNGRTNPKVEQE